MGHKVSPLLQRIGYIQDWRSKWFAKKGDFPKFLQADSLIRKLIKTRCKQAGVALIIIERLSDKIRIKIHAGRPGVIIGSRGQDIERLRQDLSALVHQEVAIDIIEVKAPASNAQLVAENVTFQLEKRIAFRRAVKRSIEQAMSSGAKGIKISCAGRLGGAEMARRETYKQGKLPLSTLRADIDYGFAEALTTFGLIGVKVWIYKGEVLSAPKAPPAPKQIKAQDTRQQARPAGGVII